MTNTKVLVNGELLDGDELDFEALRDQWQEYRLEDGTLLKIKLVLAKVVRVRDRLTALAQPLYSTESQNVMTVSVRSPEP